MKKLINFDNHEEVQALADKKYGGNFSLTVNSIMKIALSSKDFKNDSDLTKKTLNGERLTSRDAIDFTEYLGTESAKVAGLPSRFIDAAMMGFDASSFNEMIKRLVDSETPSDVDRATDNIFESKPITASGEYLKTAAELVSVLIKSGGNRSPYQRRTSEKHYHTELAVNFSDYFDGYSFVASEWVTNDGADRIDILATCDKTDRDVIIELKLGAKSAHKQLRSYAYEFDNPILINISESEVKNKRSGIKYLTFEEIGVSELMEVK